MEKFREKRQWHKKVLSYTFKWYCVSRHSKLGLYEEIVYEEGERGWWRSVFTFSCYPPPITSLMQPSAENIYSQENISQFPLSTSAAAPRPGGSSITLKGWHWIYLILDICYCLNSTPNMWTELNISLNADNEAKKKLISQDECGETWY